MQNKTRRFLSLLLVLPFLIGFTPLSNVQLDSVAAGNRFTEILNLFNVVNCTTCILGGGCPDCTPMINNNDLINKFPFR
jgi:hypothetical protein